MLLKRSFVSVLALGVALAACSHAGQSTLPYAGGPSAALDAAADSAIVPPGGEVGAVSVGLALPAGAPPSTTATFSVETLDGDGRASVPATCANGRCTATLTAPLGQDRFALTLYDRAGGRIFASTSAIETVDGTLRSIPITMATATIAKIVVACTGTCKVTGGVAAQIPIVAKAYDANNALIAGTYVHPIVLVDTDANAATSLTATSLPSSTTAVTLKYTGGAFGKATISASSLGVSSSQTFASVIGPVAGDAFAGAVASSPGYLATGYAAAGVTTFYAVAVSDAGDQALGYLNYRLDSIVIGAGTKANAKSAISALANQPGIVANGLAGQPIGAVDRPPDDQQVVEMLSRLHRSNAPIEQRQLEPKFSPLLASTVGSSAKIWVAKFAIGSSSVTYVQVPATLKAKSAHGNVWIDNSLISGTNASSSFNSTNVAATVSKIASDFENGYVSDTAHFALPDYTMGQAAQTGYEQCATPTSTPGPMPVAAFVLDPDTGINVMVLNSKNLGAGVGGYFSGVNFTPQVAWNCLGTNAPKSNEAPMIYVGWFDANGATYELNEDLVRGTAHEFQHLINFVNHEIISNLIRTNMYEDAFINEGLSVLAQDYAVKTMYPTLSFDSADALRHAEAYLDNPQNYSISGFSGYDKIDSNNPWGTDVAAYNCGGGCYGSAYLFQRYMNDRFGSTYLKGMETAGLVGFANLVHNCASCNETGQQLIADFALAMAAQSTGAASASRYRFGTLNLTGTYAIPAPLGVFSTHLTGPGVLSLVGSVAGSGSIPIGGLGFIKVTGIPTYGEKVTVYDRATVSGFTLEGAFSQK